MASTVLLLIFAGNQQPDRLEPFHYMIVTRHYSYVPQVASATTTKMTETNRTNAVILVLRVVEDPRTWMSVSP